MMHVTSFAAAVLALAQAVFAAPGSTPVALRDAHKADFRSFMVPGCNDQNQGVWTLLESDNNVCKPFDQPVGSILVASDDCSLYMYADSECTAEETPTEIGECSHGDWGSFMLVCLI